MLQNNMMLINKASFEKLSPALQKLLLDEAAAVSAKNTAAAAGARGVDARGHPQVRQDEGDRQS